MAQATTAIVNKPAWVDLSSSDAGGRRATSTRSSSAGRSRSTPTRSTAATRWRRSTARTSAASARRSPRARRRRGPSTSATEDVDGARRDRSRRPAGPSSRRRSTSATRAGWPCSRTRRARSSRPGRERGWAASRRTVSNAFGWAELNARGVDKALPFYTKVFGWTTKTSDDGRGPAALHGVPAGRRRASPAAWEMNPMVPAQVPSYWQVYFTVDDVDAAPARRSTPAPARWSPPRTSRVGRFAIVSDPQGASFGLLKTRPR